MSLPTCKINTITGVVPGLGLDGVWLAMELVYVKYVSKQALIKYLLLVYLGTRSGKICGIKSDVISGGELAAVRDNLKHLTNTNLERRILWFKENCPYSYKEGYRELEEGSTSILYKYPVE